MKIIVTGSGSGIGKSISQTLRDRSYDVIGVDNKPGDGDEALDVSDENSWNSLFNTIGPVGGLVNCAGIRTRNLIVNTTIEEFERHLKVNLTGTWLGIRTLFRNHPEGELASIVNIASVNAVIAVPGQAHYVATKGGVASLTKAAAIEGAPMGIRVNAIAPGAIRPPMTEARLIDPDQVAWLEGRVPLGRVGEAEEIASVAEFLLSKESSYITGTTIFADGGWTANGV